MSEIQTYTREDDTRHPVFRRRKGPGPAPQRLWGRGGGLGTTQRLHYTLQPRLLPSDSHIVSINNEQFKSRKPPYLNITGNPVLGSLRQLCEPSCPPAGGDPTRSLRLHTTEPGHAGHPAPGQVGRRLPSHVHTGQTDAQRPAVSGSGSRPGGVQCPEPRPVRQDRAGLQAFIVRLHCDFARGQGHVLKAVPRTHF